MTENRSKSREGSPLWANVGPSTALTFNPGQLQPLLVPFNTLSQSNDSQVDAGEVDHFIGQESPVGTASMSATSSSNNLFAASMPPPSTDGFQVGYGSAPLTSASAASQSGSFLTADASFPPSQNEPFYGNSASQPPQVYQPPNMSQELPISSGFEFDRQYENSQPQYTSAEHSVAGLPMFDHLQPLSNAEGPEALVPAGSGAIHYSPVIPHWFYCKKMSDQPVWLPFSHRDSMVIEESFLNGEPEIVQTDGGRYDVSINDRERRSVYWVEENCEIRRCSWFYREDQSMKYIPYSEETAEELEEKFMQTMYNNSWHKKSELTTSNDIFVFHSSNVFVQFSKGSFADEFGASRSEISRPKVVKRGTEQVENIKNGEAQQIDEVVFVVHGIGPVCDLKFRGIVDCVDDMRNTGMTMLNSHFKTAQSNNQVGRVEFIPIYWYDALRNDAVGVDKRLGNITLPSIPKIRELTNEVLLDILFYNSPLYSQSILDRVGGELNKLYKIFLERNPGWSGKVSLAGHSLGSLILFDLLSMQGVSCSAQAQGSANKNVSAPRVPTPTSERSMSATPRSTPVDGKLMAIETMETVLEHLALTNFAGKFHEEQIDLESLLMCSEEDLKSIGLPLGPRKKILKFVVEREKKLASESMQQQGGQSDASPTDGPGAPKAELSGQSLWMSEAVSNTQVGYISGLHGVGFPLVTYPQLDFHVANFFALGSPIAVFLTIRGIENLSRDFQLPTCAHVFNIFHPYDPVAYRMEPLINPDIKHRPVQMPHHKGRKRLHLELKENIVKVGADIKEKVMRSIKSTWASINDFARAHTSIGGGTEHAPSDEELSHHVDRALEGAANTSVDERLDNSISELDSVSSMAEGEVEVGQLNQGRRIDYVLQEAPFESFNDYIFALSSHVVYWESEDVSLMLMKEIYSQMGIYPDVKEKSSSQPHHQQQMNQQLQNLTLPSNTANSNTNPYSGVPQYTPVSQPPTFYNPSMTTGIGYSNQPPVSYAAQPPVTVGFSNQPPVAGVGYANHAGPTPSGQPSGPPPLSGFVPSGPPPRAGFVPRQ